MNLTEESRSYFCGKYLLMTRQIANKYFELFEIDKRKIVREKDSQ